MGQVRARTEDEFRNRRNEILSACEHLCRDREYDEITLTDIAQMTALSRTSMYNYYRRKEDLFLDLLKKQCAEWADELNAAFQQHETLSEADLCHIFTEVLCRYEMTLRLITQVLSSIEKTCPAESVELFRKVEERIPTILLNAIGRVFPHVPIEDCGNLAVQLMIYTYGIYPITHFPKSLTEKWAHDGRETSVPDMSRFATEGIRMLIHSFCNSHPAP